MPFSYNWNNALKLALKGVKGNVSCVNRCFLCNHYELTKFIKNLREILYIDGVGLKEHL
jgi:homospermidine synthase